MKKSGFTLLNQSVLHGIRTLMVMACIGLSGLVLAGYNGINQSEIASSGGIVLNSDVQGRYGARVWMQYGEVKAGVYESRPHCYFKVRRQSSDLDTPFGITASQFDVTAIDNTGQTARVAPGLTPPVQVAAFGAGGAGEGGSAHQLTLATVFHLNDPAQPNVKKLVCAIFADPRDRGFLTLQEMRAAMGNLVTITE